MDPHERATSVWYRVAGLLRRKDLAIEIVEAEIRSAQHEILLDRERSASQRDIERAAKALPEPPNRSSARGENRTMTTNRCNAPKAIFLVEVRANGRRGPP
jgi:hypothetical protein